MHNSSNIVFRQICTGQYVRNIKSTAILPEISQFNPNLRTHQELYEFSLEHPEEFWGTLAKSRLTWMKPFEKVMDCDMKEGHFKWFLGGKLNVAGKGI